MVRHDYLKNLLREKEILSLIDHPNIIRLEDTFKDENSLYFVLEYHPNGDLAKLIKNNGPLPLETTRIYAMEILCALEELRNHDIVHRDMKPENILIDEEGHCILADFGSSKIIDVEEMNEQLKSAKFDTEEIEEDEYIEFEPDFDDHLKLNRLTHEDSVERKGTFVGTPLYVSPEMLLHNIGCFSSDLWGLGCIIYQCLTGKAPFFGTTANKVFEQILNGEFKIPSYVDQAAQDLIRSLLHPDPLQRLGSGERGSSNDIASLKNHVFFNKSSFKHLHSQKVPKFNLLKLSSVVEEDEFDKNFDDLNYDMNNLEI